MKGTLKEIVKTFMPHRFLRLYWKFMKWKDGNKVRTLTITIFDNCPVNYYGQCGEDVLLRLFLATDMNYKGFYVDIGAYHPIYLSNTKYFYENGWNGINIDANPISIKDFNEMRKRDINIESGVSDEYGELEYYYFGETSTINTFDKKQAKSFEGEFGTKVKEIKKVKVQPINDILEKYLPQGQHIDFLTIDVESFEIRILKSFDFEKYAPDFILVEDLNYKNYVSFQKSHLRIFLKEKGYVAVGKTDLTILFKRV
jgi:FkbM family methyltransferase